MRPDSRSVSFTFHREVLSVKNSPEIAKAPKNLRRRLQDRFEEKPGEKMPKEKQPGDRSWNNLSLGNMSADSRRALRCGAEKLSKTISSVRTTFGTISQVGPLVGSMTEGGSFPCCTNASLLGGLEIQELDAQAAEAGGAAIAEQHLQGADSADSLSTITGQDTHEALQPLRHRVAQARVGQRE